MPAARSWYLRVSRRNSSHSSDSRGVPQLAGDEDAFLLEPRRGLRADAEQAPDQQRVQHRVHVLRADHREPVGLAHLRAELREQLVVRHADRGREPGAVADAPLDLARHVVAAAEQADAAGDVEEGLVERQPLDLVGEFVEHLEHLRRDLAVALEARRHDDRLRAAPQHLAHRHRRMHAEAAHLVARGGHHAAPPAPPTTTGWPASSGRSCCSTAA